MSTFKSAAQVAAKMERVAADMRRLPEKLVQKAGDIVAREVKQNAASKKIPRNKPAKLGAKVALTARSGSAGASATVTPVPRGLWSILEEGAGAHVVTSKFGGGSRKSRAKAFEAGDMLGGGRRAVVNIPGVGYRRWAVVPKTKAGGAGTWDGGIRNAFGPVRDATGIDISRIVEGD